MAKKNVVVAKSERLYLSPMRLEDTEAYTKWQNDARVYGQIRDMSVSVTYEIQYKWIEATLKDPAQRVFSIYYIPEDKLIGHGGFKHLDFYDKNGEVWEAIGETEYWRRGLGKEALWLLCKYGFEKLDLKNILGEQYVTNPVAIHNAKKLGGKFIGIRRKCKKVGEEWVDAYYEDWLPEDLIKPESDSK